MSLSLNTLSLNETGPVFDIEHIKQGIKYLAISQIAKETATRYHKVGSNNECYALMLHKRPRCTCMCIAVSKSISNLSSIFNLPLGGGGDYEEIFSITNHGSNIFQYFRTNL